MKKTFQILAVASACLPTLQAQVAGLPATASEIISGTISGNAYDVILKDGTRQTGCIHSRLDGNGNGSIISWPDGGSVTVTRIHNGNAVIIGPSGQ